MFMNIIHIAHITGLLTNDAWHAYIVIFHYKIDHGAARITYFARSGPISGGGGMPPGQLANTVGQKKYCID